MDDDPLSEKAGDPPVSTSSATPPATRRIARSYLTDLVAAIPLPADVQRDGRVANALIAPVVEQLLGRAIQVRHVLRSDQLVLTFDLADDPAGWATGPAADPVGRPENRDYPGQPGEHHTTIEQGTETTGGTP